MVYLLWCKCNQGTDADLQVTLQCALLSCPLNVCVEEKMENDHDHVWWPKSAMHMMRLIGLPEPHKLQVCCPVGYCSSRLTPANRIYTPKANHILSLQRHALALPHAKHSGLKSLLISGLSVTELSFSQNLSHASEGQWLSMTEVKSEAAALWHNETCHSMSIAIAVASTSKI